MTLQSRLFPTLTTSLSFSPSAELPPGFIVPRNSSVVVRVRPPPAQRTLVRPVIKGAAALAGEQAATADDAGAAAPPSSASAAAATSAVGSLCVLPACRLPVASALSRARIAFNSRPMGAPLFQSSENRRL